MPARPSHQSRLATLALVVMSAGLAAVVGLWPGPRPNNVLIFVADGLRSGIVSPETAPEMASVRSEGVDFQNSHSLYPTVTTPNASAIALGHGLGDTGDFGNILWAGAQTNPETPSLVAAVENDGALGAMNRQFGGNYLNEVSLLASARARGFSTAAIGKLGPTAIQDVTERSGMKTIIIDDATGHPGGLPLAPEIASAIQAAGLSLEAEDRGLNGDPGDSTRSGVHVANVQQQNWFAAIACKVLLTRFKAAGKPFVMVFWSRDPDGTQHFNGDSLNQLTPGINGPTSLAGIRNADTDLKQLRDTLRSLDLDKTTDIVVTADHGFSVISKQSQTSLAARNTSSDTPQHFLPRGFLSVDLAEALNKRLFQDNGLEVDWRAGAHPRSDAELLGEDPKKPEIAIAANGGSDLIYLFGRKPRNQARDVVKALIAEDYVGGVFVNDALGPIAGTLPLSTAGLMGEALTKAPSLVIGFRSFSTGCSNPEICAAEVADTEYQQGQGNHGSFSRADTHNFMAAIGPDFKTRFVDRAPVSNADWTPTLRRILHLKVQAKGALAGRAMIESLVGGRQVSSGAKTLRSPPAKNGFQTILNEQNVGAERYFDAAGAPGRIVGLKP